MTAIILVVVMEQKIIFWVILKRVGKTLTGLKS